MLWLCVHRECESRERERERDRDRESEREEEGERERGKLMVYYNYINFIISFNELDLFMAKKGRDQV